jgi:hypothetical protein
MRSVLQDLRYGSRMLAKSPGFTAVAVITLALGIGANTAIFSVVRAVLLPPLPFTNPGRLAQIDNQNRKTGEQSNWVAYRDVADWRARSGSFESIGAHGFALLNLSAGGQPDALYDGRVSAEVLPTLGVQPALGRFFSTAEDRPGQDQVIILSYDLWQRRFGGDPGIVGRRIQMTGQRLQDYTVIGVMPRGFNFPLNVPSAVNLPTHQMAYWIPFGVDAMLQIRDGVRCLLRRHSAGAFRRAGTGAGRGGNLRRGILFGEPADARDRLAGGVGGATGRCVAAGSAAGRGPNGGGHRGSDWLARWR